MRFDWINELPDDARVVLLASLGEFINVLEDFVPVELNDDETLSGLLDLRDELEETLDSE
jgi:hypothetical protein